MKKTIAILFLLLLLVGCESDTSVIGELKESTVDSSVHGYEMGYEGLSNPYKSILSNTIRVKDFMYVWQNTVDGKSFLSVYDIANNELNYLNDSPIIECSGNTQECSGYFDMVVKDFTYYNDKLYYSASEYDNELGRQTYGLYQMNLDTTNRERVFSSPNLMDTTPEYYFHRGYLYYLDGNQLLKFNIADWEYEVLIQQDDMKLHTVLFDGDKGYILVSDYLEDGKMHSKAALEMDVNTKNIKIANTFEEHIMFMSNTHIVEYREGHLLIKNRETNEESVLSNVLAHVFKHEEYIILSEQGNGSLEEDTTQYILANLDGTIYDRIEKGSSRGIGEHFDGKYFYTSQIHRSLDNSSIISKDIIRYRIVDNKFQEPELLFNIPLQ